MVVVHSIPDGLSASAIEADVRVLDAAHAVGVTLEGLGYSVYARVVPLRVVRDIVGGTVRLAWRKLRPSVEEERRRSDSQKTLNGSNGSRSNWSDIPQEKPTCRSARMKHIATGNGDDERP
jgi:hypothetical protein